MDKKLEKEFKFYLDHQDELVKKYNSKFLVIKEQEIVGVYNSQIEAYNEAKKKYEIGSFLIQYCSPGESAYTQTFHSRVAFDTKH